jgi:hypothetical protein
MSSITVDLDVMISRHIHVIIERPGMRAKIFRRTVDIGDEFRSRATKASVPDLNTACKTIYLCQHDKRTSARVTTTFLG